VLRAPFDGQTAYSEITLPATTTGPNCQDVATPAFDCSGFEHFEVSAAGSLAILVGNSAATVASFADSVPAVFVSNPFDDGARQLAAVQIAANQAVPGRGTGAVRFQPARVFRAGFEVD
jgi:hypothetical protein